MQNIIDSILTLLNQDEAIVLCTIISHSGSTPRDTGTRFIVRSNGSAIGTIGGGLVEVKTIEKAAEVLQTKQSVIFDFDMSHKHLDMETMICGGRMSTLIEYLEPTSENISFYAALKGVFEKRRESLLIIDIAPAVAQSGNPTHAIVVDGETVYSSLPAALPPAVLTSEVKTEFRDGRAIQRPIEGMQCWMEPLQFPKKLFLFGGGHVARPTADIASSAGFETTVIDDREEVITRENYPERIRIHHIDSFDGCVQDFEVDADSYVVILTRGHKSDKSVLAQVLRTDAKYVGMIGSRKKRNTIYNLLQEDGFSQGEIDRVHCPVGLNIGADTPEEIAVSIVAELIGIRAGI